MVQRTRRQFEDAQAKFRKVFERFCEDAGDLSRMIKAVEPSG